jgi:subtilase family serine protease
MRQQIRVSAEFLAAVNNETQRARSRSLAACLATIMLLSLTAAAQEPVARITQQINNSERVAIRDSHPPSAMAENEIGPVPPAMKLPGINLVFSRTAAQEADLQALIAAQQDPASPLYQTWLTPDDFAARFGVADSDIAEVKFWLQQQGFSIDGVSRSKNRITFSGTVGQVETAFSLELHYYMVNGKKYFAPADDIHVPAAFSSLVQNVTNLSTFRPIPHVKFRTPQPVPQFTSGNTGKHYLTPKDVATIYDVSAAYNAGYNGTGQSIAVVGQSAVELSDIENFQSAAGLSTKDPSLVLVPNSGDSAVSYGDEAESDLDLEYTGAMAPAATIYFVYTGDNSNYNVWDSISYAVDNSTAPIISVSYGTCETALSSSDYSTLNGTLKQAASQGQSVIVASGDTGSTDCYRDYSMSKSKRQALAVDFPASSQYVTAIGGTEFSADDVDSSNTTYWTSASGRDIVGSALSYIPEQVWNDDDSSSGLSSGGGGVSSKTSRPSWQTGVNGMPSGSYRFVPDISLASSASNPGYLYCSSDWTTGIRGSCSKGFRDKNNRYLTVAGGTSFAAPILRECWRFSIRS